VTWFKILARTSKPEKREPEKPARKAKPRGKALSSEDHALWSHVARSITPLDGRILPDLTEMPPPPAPQVRGPSPVPEASQPRQPTLPPLARLDKRSLRQISRGSTEIDARIDLHGMRQSEAHAALHSFLSRLHHSGARVALVITGKGARNLESSDARGEERGVLRRLVPHWLADPAMRRIVMGFESAARGHGGEGALYVRLRRKKDHG
jgi:DNA-nicking Smr family endonuclease